MFMVPEVNFFTVAIFFRIFNVQMGYCIFALVLQSVKHSVANKTVKELN